MTTYQRYEPDPKPRPEPAEEPETEPADEHRGPLDDDEDGRYLARDDPRRHRGGLLGKVERLLGRDDDEGKDE